MNRKINEMPFANQQIMKIINDKFGGNVSRFSSSMGLKNSSKINRLFKKDNRSGEYPMPSTDIVMLISNTFGYSTDYILLEPKEQSNEAKTINNIDINYKTIEGDRNNIDSGNKVSDDYLSVIKTQQEQINTLLNLLTNGK